MTAGSPSSRRFPLCPFWGGLPQPFVDVWVLLPAGLLHTGQLAGMCHLTQADAAEPELAINRMRAAAPVAPRVAAHLELGLLVGLVDQSLLCHLFSSP